MLNSKGQGSRGSSKIVVHEESIEEAEPLTDKSDTADKGFRCLILAQNKLGDMFASALEHCLGFDRYLKYLDLSHNQISVEGLKTMVGASLRENSSIVTLDIRFNKGTTSRLQKQVSLQMLKNIQIHMKKKKPLLESWIKAKALYHPEVPEAVYKALGLDRLLLAQESQHSQFDGENNDLWRNDPNNYALLTPDARDRDGQLNDLLRSLKIQHDCAGEEDEEAHYMPTKKYKEDEYNEYEYTEKHQQRKSKSKSQKISGLRHDN